MNKKGVEIIEISKRFGKLNVLNDLSLSIRKGEFISLLGPSGCGKTTLLRIIAGLIGSDIGKVLIDGIDMTIVPAHRRPVNMVFQNYGLFPHMNVYDNIAFGPRISKWPESQIKEEIKTNLKLVGLEGYENRNPEKLSGGQKQRVAVARALINKPKVLLLDEPLGALDLQIRKQMQIELKKIHYELTNTFIYVTHDQEEALVLSDRIAVMDKGRIKQFGTPNEIYNNPVDSFTAGFIGESNLIKVELLRHNKNETVLKIGENQIFSSVFSGEYIKGNKVCILIRPESINISERIEGLKSDNILDATVVVVYLFRN